MPIPFSNWIYKTQGHDIAYIKPIATDEKEPRYIGKVL